MTKTSKSVQNARSRAGKPGKLVAGGTLERPGLQRLLAEIAGGHIDIVVVYKVDRLTRSLLDFARLVEAFDKAGASFVSITQSFNTTTSMGRLTLNMLLSFAQFEREVTAERIRDKIAQSKARGMWMGGTPPVGYRPDGRSLAIVEEGATAVRQIFNCYAELGNVRFLAEDLEVADICSPMRKAATGRAFGGRPFSPRPSLPDPFEPELHRTDRSWRAFAPSQSCADHRARALGSRSGNPRCQQKRNPWT
jgi:DNA invertase Pin-like site-specific DNA recombinase